MYLGRDKQAQMHVIDAVAAVSIIIFAIVAATQLSAVPSVSTPQTTNQLKAWADDALRNLDSQESNTSGMTWLEYYLNHKVGGDTSDCDVLDTKISKYLPSYLPKSYNLYYYNSSTDNTVVWLPEDGDAKTAFGIVVRSHRIVVLNNGNDIYDVILEVWRAV